MKTNLTQFLISSEHMATLLGYGLYTGWYLEDKEKQSLGFKIEDKASLSYKNMRLFLALNLITKQYQD